LNIENFSHNAQYAIFKGFNLLTMIIQDTYGRTFKTLRVSLTSACNFGCTYCVTGGMRSDIAAPNALTYVQLAVVIDELHKLLKLTSVRLTGGEPLLYPYLVPLVELLSLKGIENIKMTTNGFLLKRKAEALAFSGVKEINVSFDAVTPQTFFAVTRRDSLTQVIEGIDAAIENGISVKLNSVIMRGMNEVEILPLLDFAMSRNIPVRFIELMRMGHLYSSDYERYFFSMDEIIDVIRKKYSTNYSYRSPSATAKCWTLDNGYQFGIIANESEPFCSDCDRLRLDSSGNIYGCLSEDKREYIADVIQSEILLTEKLQEALSHKQPFKFKGNEMKMIEIGG